MFSTYSKFFILFILNSFEISAFFILNLKFPSVTSKKKLSFP